MRVTGHFVPGAPAVDRMAALRECGDRTFGESALDMQRVACLAEREAARPEPRHLDRLLNVETEIDHRRIELELDLRLAVRAHATQHAPQLAVPLGDGGDQGVQRDLAGFEAIGMIWVERKIGAPV